MSGIRYQVSGIRYQVSGIRYQVSGIRYQATSNQQPATNNQQPITSNQQLAIMKKTTLLIILAALVAACTNRQPEIFEWRGPERSGVYNESGLLKSWPDDGPAEIWTIDDLGNGYGSPVFTEKHFFITGEKDTITSLYCFSLDGKMIWQTKLGKEFMRSYPGGRDAPTVVDDLIYIGTGLGNLYCVKRGDGEIVWSRFLKEDYDGVLPLHGYSEAPLVDGDRVFWTPGGKVNNVVAINRFNGELIWSNPGFGEPQGYNQPKLISLPARNLLVTFSSYHLMGFDTKSGEMVWYHEQDNLPLEKRKPGYGDTHSSTVLYEDGYIWYVAGDGNCAVKLMLAEDGTTVTEVWRNKNLSGYMGGIVKLGDYIYGDVQWRPGLRSINAITGELIDSLRNGEGAVIAADGMLYFYNTRGVMHLIEPDNGRLMEISTFRITKGTKEHFSHPVINRGILYVRRGNSLMAYDIRSVKNN